MLFRNRVRSAHREVLLSLGKLRRLGVGGPGELYQSHAAAPQPLPAAQRRNDAGPGARQGDFRPHAQEERHAHSGSQPVRGVPFRAALHQPETVRCGHRQGHGPVAAHRHAAVEQHRAHRAVSARRLGANGRRGLGGVQSERCPGGHQRSTERRPQRSDRVSENPMKQTFTLVVVAACFSAVTPALGATPEMPRFRWENFTTANGLPDDHVFNVCVDGDRVWAATENGLGLYEKGKWKVYGTKDGLAHRAVLGVAVDRRTGVVWAATMGGLSRFSAGRFDNFTQLNSGLSNDVVYGVGVEGDHVWVATAAGASRLDTRTGQWALVNQRTTAVSLKK